ncbi:MAG: transporter [Sporomusaceae bacterium]|nr:transporter [Sporomusaceae bacterium]
MLLSRADRPEPSPLFWQQDGGWAEPVVGVFGIDLQTKLAYLFIDLILPLALGLLCRRQGWGSRDLFQQMITINICVIYPVLSVLTLWALPLQPALIWLPLIGLLLCAIPGLAAYWRLRGKFCSDLDKGSYLLSAILSNTTTLGGLCAFILYSETGYAYAQMIVMLQNVVMFMICFPLAQYYYQKSIGSSLKGLTFSSLFINRNQLPVVGMAAGILLNLSGLIRPAALAPLLDPLVHIGAWTALIPIGFAIDTAGMRCYYTTLLDLLPIKFILTPVAAYWLSSLFIHDEIILNTIVILAAMPTAINSIIAVQIHKLNVNIAAAAFVLTTAAFIGIELPALLVWLTILP